MVFGNSSIKQSATMSVSVDPCSKSRQLNQFQKNKKMPNSSNHPSCSQSQSAVIDLMIFIAVVGAFGFLLYPYVKFTYIKTAEIGSLVFSVLRDEVYEYPAIYGCLGLSMMCVIMAACAILVCTHTKCRNPTCLGLWKAAEFDIQIESEECVKNSNLLVKDGVKKGLFEIPRDHHRELELELKKIAPPNGRAVLLFRARCGCSLGKMEVPGPKKARKTKK